MMIQITRKIYQIPCIIAEVSWKFHQNPLIICWVMSGFSIEQSAWWSGSLPNSNHLFLLPHRESSIQFHHNPSIVACINEQKDKETERKTDKQINATETITSLAKEVMRSFLNLLSNNSNFIRSTWLSVDVFEIQHSGFNSHCWFYM